MGEKGVWARHDVTLPKSPLSFHSFATERRSSLRFVLITEGLEQDQNIWFTKRETQENTLQCFTNLYFQIMPYFNYVKVTWTNTVYKDLLVF